MSIVSSAHLSIDNSPPQSASVEEKEDGEIEG